MNFNHLARFGVLVAIVALPACSGGGASAPALSAAIPSVNPQTQSVKLRPVNLRTDTVVLKNTSNLRSDSVKPVVATVTLKTTNLRSDTVKLKTTNLRSSYMKPVATPAPTPAPVVTVQAASVRLGSPHPHIASPSNLRSDSVLKKTTNLRSSIIINKNKVPAAAVAVMIQTSSVRLLHPGVNPGPFQH